MERRPEAGAWQVGGAVDGWWDRERSDLLSEQLEPRLRSAGLIGDVGCGWGSFSERMANESEAFTVGSDFEPYLTWKNVPGQVAYVVCDARRLPFRSELFDVVVALDVIEHFADDQLPLGELNRITSPNGVVGIAVPALPSLWSQFDESVGHFRRYTPRTLRQACHTAGLAPKQITYFFSWLVPPAWLLRKRNRRNADRTRPGVLGRVVDKGVAAVCSIERAWLRRWALPFGTSLWALSTKSASTST